MGMIRLLIAAILLLSVVFIAGCDQAPENLDAEASTFDLGDFLGDASDQGDDKYQQAQRDYPISLPRDHLSHPGFRSEWWYLNGNLHQTDDPQRRFGFNFTIFRQALAADASVQNSWLRPQFYMGHLAIADFSRGQHRSSERFAREGPGLAGTADKPLRVWLDNWQLQASDEKSLFPATLQAQDRSCDCGYVLQITPLKAAVLQGDQGYSPKRRESGYASHYYSFTRLQVRGELRLGQERVAVEGRAWYDHEWASNTLADYQQGWDWFSVQLEDGRDLMFIRLRSKDPDRADFDQLSLVDAAGVRIDRPGDRVLLEATEHWQSSDRVRYPVAWTLKIPAQGLDLQIRARQPDQEMRHSMRYWEGAVSVAGSHQGQGYVELTGYADTAQQSGTD